MTSFSAYSRFIDDMDMTFFDAMFSAWGKSGSWFNRILPSDFTGLYCAGGEL